MNPSHYLCLNVLNMFSRVKIRCCYFNISSNSGIAHMNINFHFLQKHSLLHAKRQNAELHFRHNMYVQLRVGYAKNMHTYVDVSTSHSVSAC